MLCEETAKLKKYIESNDEYKDLWSWIPDIEVERIDNDSYSIYAVESLRQLAPGEEYPAAKFLDDNEPLRTLLISAVRESLGCGGVKINGNEY